MILFAAALYAASKHSAKHKMTTQQLVFCAIAMAITSFVKIYELPWCGSVTLYSMLFILLVEGILTVMIISVPAVSKALEKIRDMALQK